MKHLLNAVRFIALANNARLAFPSNNVSLEISRIACGLCGLTLTLVTPRDLDSQRTDSRRSISGGGSIRMTERAPEDGADALACCGANLTGLATLVEGLRAELSSGLMIGSAKAAFFLRNTAIPVDANVLRSMAESCAAASSGWVRALGVEPPVSVMWKRSLP